MLNTFLFEWADYVACRLRRGAVSAADLGVTLGQVDADLASAVYVMPVDARFVKIIVSRDSVSGQAPL
jgi:hypothetical protein